MKRWATILVVALLVAGCGLLSPPEEILCEGVEACDAVGLAELAGATCTKTDRVAEIGGVTFVVWECE